MRHILAAIMRHHTRRARRWNAKHGRSAVTTRATTDGCLFTTEPDGSDPAGKVRTFCTTHGSLWPCEGAQTYGGDSKVQATFHGKERWCEECQADRGVEDDREEQIGYEERARRVWVTSLDCGHDIVREMGRHA